MSKYNKLTSVEILLILAIIAVLAVWLLPRFLKLIDSDSGTVGFVKPFMVETSETAIPAPILLKFRNLYFYTTADIG